MPPVALQHVYRRSGCLGRLSTASPEHTDKIEHRLFSFISKNWRGQPLVSHEVIINLIAATTTRTGLDVYARLDQSLYPNQIQVTDDQLAAVNLDRHAFHPEWNYTIKPSPK